jgi:phosphoglycerol transferase MdoB-like AlkP superfamily enzyme
MNNTDNNAIILSDEDLDQFTIEGLKSQEYSIGIFFFMMAGIILFAVVVYKFARDAYKDGKRNGEKGMRKGEVVLFAWLIFGLICAVIYGAAQLLFGQLI